MSVNFDSKQIAKEYPDLNTILEALVLASLETVREMHSDFLTDPDYVKGGMPTLKQLKDYAVEFLVETVPEMESEDKPMTFRELVDQIATRVVSYDPSLLKLEYTPRRDSL